MEPQIGFEEKKYNIWYKDQKENHGLTSIHISWPINKIVNQKDGNIEIEYKNQNVKREDFFKELNLMNEAIAEGKIKPYIDDVETFIE